MRLKFETSTHVKSFISPFQTHFQKTIKTITTDNSPLFFLKDFYAKQGIFLQTFCVDTPQHNNIVERKHQHILNVARSLVF